MGARLLRVTLFVLAASAAVAAAEPSPVPAVLTAWRQAVERGDAAAAWALLAEEARAGHTPESFREAFDADRAELLRRARAWEGGTPLLRAEVPVGLATVRLVRTEAGWRVDGVPVPAGAEAAPTDAAKAAARLLREGRLDALRLALTGEARAALDARLEAAARALEAAAGDAEGGAPDEVRAALPDGTAVRLVRTPGGWCIDGLPWPPVR